MFLFSAAQQETLSMLMHVLLHNLFQFTQGCCQINATSMKIANNKDLETSLLVLFLFLKTSQLGKNSWKYFLHFYFLFLTSKAVYILGKPTNTKVLFSNYPSMRR